MTREGGLLTHSQPPSALRLACGTPSGCSLPGCLGPDSYAEEGDCQRGPMLYPWPGPEIGPSEVWFLPVCARVCVLNMAVCVGSDVLAIWLSGPCRTTHGITVALQLPQLFTGPHTRRDTHTVQCDHTSHPYRCTHTRAQTERHTHTGRGKLNSLRHMAWRHTHAKATHRKRFLSPLP